jgi:hypothetical protein
VSLPVTTLPPLASIADLEAHLGHPVDPASGVQALENASGWVRDYCGWVLSRETAVTFTVDGSGTGVLDLPTLWLVTVDEVRLAGAALVEDGDDAYGYTWTRAGQIFRPVGWPCRARIVEVDCEHGYDPIPHGIRGFVVALAGRSAENPQNIRMETVGTVIRQFHEPGAVTESLDFNTLDMYRLPGKP